MKKYLIPFILLTVVACSKFDELSKNPYALYEAPAESYVHPIMFKTAYNSISIFRNSTSLLMQYGVNHNTENSSRVISNYNIQEGIIDDAWTAYYLQYGNAVKMYDQALKDKKSGLQGVALILRSLLIMQITDAYGDVPFKEAGQLVLSGGSGKYTTAYDSQKDIYLSVVAMLEDANTLLGEEEEISFDSVCDKTFGGNYEKWRRFGNSLYARVLMRIGMKVMDESEGILVFDDDEDRAPISVPDRLAKIYQSYLSENGEYPVMRSRDDRPMVHFDKYNETEQTPFFGYTSGNWNAITACTTLCERMLDGEYKVFERAYQDGSKTKPFGDKLIWQALVPTDANFNGHAPDPRYTCWFRKLNGMPTQMTSAEQELYYNEFRSKGGNFLGGSMMRGSDAEPDVIWGKVYDLQNASYYPLMQYSELPFIFAEAGARGWIAAIEGEGPIGTLLRQAVTESILEWNPYFNETSQEVTDYVTHVMTGEKFSGATFNVGPAGNALEAILTEKWIATFFVGIESWCDYRRTGYPLLKTNGPGAENNKILPTRMRYPSDEAYRNVVSYADAVNGWLGGSNNMQTDVWWADTQESKDNRLKGRQ